MTNLLSFRNTVIALAITTSATALVLTNAKSSVNAELAEFKQIHAPQSPFKIQSVTLADNIGTATVESNGYSIEVAFDYEVVDDSNGILGHSDQTIQIDTLKVNSVMSSATGTEYKDWTESEDHWQIIAQIRAYVDQNRLAQGV